MLQLILAVFILNLNRKQTFVQGVYKDSFKQPAKRDLKLIEHFQGFATLKTH
jgi:hypothetical protein